MVKNDPSTGKGEQTRRHIFETALVLFREKGFDATTMQQIAERADVAKSAAYYYFPSKEAIIQAYYEEIQARQEQLCGKVFAATDNLHKRIAAAMHSKLDLAKDDRVLLGVVFRYTGAPAHPLSCLGPGTEEIRRRSIAVFQMAIETVWPTPVRAFVKTENIASQRAMEKANFIRIDDNHFISKRQIS